MIDCTKFYLFSAFLLVVLDELVSFFNLCKLTRKGGVEMLWFGCCFAASGPEQFAVIESSMNFAKYVLNENVKNN